jgi:hypothetical protein
MKKIFFYIFFFSLFQTTGGAQPLLSSKQTVLDRLVFKDAKVRNKYYYGPGKLSLSVDAQGKPVFQLLSLRYTGTALSGTEGEKRFTNLLNFGITMDPFSGEEKEALRQALKLPASADLSPLPIRNLESVIVSGLGKTDQGDAGRLRKHADVQTAGDNKEGAPGVYWTERVFTVPLSNPEAQILWDQQVNGRVAMSLNYTFYADLLKIEKTEVEITGDSVLVQELKDNLEGEQPDTTLNAEVVSAGVVDILVDVKQHPDALKKIDINENSIPPAYAALEIKCYDFSLGLRPDLAFKNVEVEGTSVNGQPVIVKSKFAQKQPDLNSKFISFPYALRMDKPLRYRMVEVPYDGERYTSPWKTLEKSTNLIDISTKQKENPIERFCVDVEILPEFMEENGVVEATVHFVYQYESKPLIQKAIFKKDDENLFKTICVTAEKAKPVQYFIGKKYGDGRVGKGVLRALPKDGYILISK